MRALLVKAEILIRGFSVFRCHFPHKSINDNSYRNFCIRNGFMQVTCQIYHAKPLQSHHSLQSSIRSKTVTQIICSKKLPFLNTHYIFIYIFTVSRSDKYEPLQSSMSFLAISGSKQ
ncbi:hypothetical protein GDO78_012156 [Eleutherodactylus coqui]|uniref:Uncharacterized protein n=1 Tax=Eleutherodactylus coqui TaxID=57060 RepID=A0A8J6F5K2_ELECQ|nr:hypothetical protein GDO78_012156 [Eleutherodactylus coqui]